MNSKDAQAQQGISAEDSLQLFKATAELSFNSIVITDADHRILYVNSAFCNMTGYSADELAGQNPKILQGPMTEKTVIKHLYRELMQRGNFFGSTFNYCKNGRPYLVEWLIKAINDDAGHARFYVSIQKDITQLHAVESTGNLFAKAIDAAYDGIFITDAKGIIEFANQGFEIITGYTPTEVIGRSPTILKSGCHDKSFYKGHWRQLNGGLPFRTMIVNRHKNGQDIHCQQSITAIKNVRNEITHFISIIRDLTDRVFDELKLREQASHDSLTGLLNRRAGEIDLNLALIQAQEKESPFSLLMLDIDDFKPVNDTWGHPRGDEVIKEVAEILMEQTRKTDKCIRWGGEEFIVLLPFCGLSRAREVAEGIRHVMAEIEFEDIGQITLSVGVTESTADDFPASILERVDQRMYQAKKTGKNRVESD